MATIEAVSSGTRGQGLPRTSRGNSMIASPASSHTQEEQRVQKLKSTPQQQLARTHQKSTNNVQKGKPITCPTGLLSDAETSGGKHSKTKMPNIEACKGQQHPAKSVIFRI